MKGLTRVLAGVLLAGAVLAGGATRAAAGGVEQSVVMTSHGLQSLADAPCNVTNSIIVPADAGQECAILVNIGANSARLGDANCGASRCAPIAAGGTVTLCTTDNIYCYSASGTTFAITKVQQ
jgi:hypothetical protein